ncbi:TIGR02281 family clan AA aspartic protease [Epibacterium sp. SM1979]|uniref:TIGR02281 family clan AA aspartic protease n=1 Tax=Tritonibacter litoralis TaxID=2662264 RepID=A0A843YBT1_9RHOB|nr:TIGR02281 family clan AA aspartic protease [Tritonibacter litoralis]MQQ07338.1 TIGR02281 family clan AA aspartic protease [Tritonibacter litoralis]
MPSFDIAHLIYLVVLLIAVLFWFVAQNRQSMNQTLQQVVIWVFIFIGVIAGYGLWEDIRGDLVPQQSLHADGDSLMLPRARDGHYYLTAEVDGVPVQFLVDTGASQVVLSLEDAARIGYPADELVFHGRASTANGEVRTAMVRLDEFVVDGFHDKNVRAWVNEGALEQSLLGMSYLQRWSRIEIRDNALVLTR